MSQITGWSVKNFDEFHADIHERSYHYNSRVYAVRDGGDLHLVPPETIYTSLTFFPLLFKPDFYKPTKDPLQRIVSRRAINGIISIFLGALFTVFFQLTCIYYLNEDVIVEHQKSNCHLGSKLLRLICLGTFVANVGSEMLQSFDMRRYIQQIPVWTEDDREICERLETSLVAQNICVPTYEGVEYSITHISKGGITPGYRLFMYAVFALKWMIEIALLFVGSSYVLYSAANSDMVLNTLSVAFIINIDNFMYSFIVSKSYKKMLQEGIPKLGLVSGTPRKEFSLADNVVDRHWQEYASVYIIVMCDIMIVVLYYWWCGWDF